MTKLCLPSVVVFGMAVAKCPNYSNVKCECKDSFDDMIADSDSAMLGFTGPNAHVTHVDSSWYLARSVSCAGSDTSCSIDDDVTTGVTHTDGFDAEVSVGLLSALSLKATLKSGRSITMYSKRTDHLNYDCPAYYNCDFNVKKHVVHYSWCWRPGLGKEKQCTCAGTHTFVDWSDQWPNPMKPKLNLAPLAVPGFSGNSTPLGACQPGVKCECYASFNDGSVGMMSSRGEVVHVELLRANMQIMRTKCTTSPIDCPMEVDFEFGYVATESTSSGMTANLASEVATLAVAASHYTEDKFQFTYKTHLKHTCTARQECCALADQYQVAMKWCSQKGGGKGIDCNCFGLAFYTDLSSITYEDCPRLLV